ncbi:MAG: hypothetical protein HY791_09335 [Deltaproteobacteria bacterium]|nr:hypothetical protein [Deltaproteobacteria bacterium]
MELVATSGPPKVFEPEETLAEDPLGSILRARRFSQPTICIRLGAAANPDQARAAVQLAAELLHPGVLPVLELVSDAEAHFVVFEHAEAVLLSSLGALARVPAIHVLREIARTLIETRAFRGAEFSVRASRVLITARGEVVLIGLGLESLEPTNARPTSEAQQLLELARELLPGAIPADAVADLDALDAKLGALFFKELGADPAKVASVLAELVRAPPRSAPKLLATAIPSSFTGALDARALPVVPQPLADDDRDSGRLSAITPPIHAGWLGGPVVISRKEPAKDAPAGEPTAPKFVDPSSLPDLFASPAPTPLPPERSRPRLDGLLWFLAGFLTALLLVLVSKH